MSNLPIKDLLRTDNVKNRFSEILKDRASSFTANLAVMVNNSGQLKECESMSIISAAIIAASLDLQLDPNLGFAAIVPFSDKGIKKAQFQIMYKGLIQLAIRSGQYSRIGVTEIYKGQLKSENPLTGDYEFDFTVKSDVIIGFAAYFKMINGFEKTEYWSIEKTKAHGQRFSQTFKKGFGLWKDDFNSMGKKTVLKNLISKWGMLSIEMQKAVMFDQSTVSEDLQPEYTDNIEETETIEDLTPDHPDWENAKKGLKSGGITIDLLKVKYMLSAENEKLLQDGN